MVRFCRPQYSAAASTSANTMSVEEISHRLRAGARMTSRSRYPRTMIGSEPMITIQAMR
jgi:hypothetical protein